MNQKQALTQVGTVGTLEESEVGSDLSTVGTLDESEVGSDLGRYS